MTTTDEGSALVVVDRPLPVITPENRVFFTSGGDGRLRIARCQDCGFYVHPPTPRCARCLSSEVVPEAVSGLASVYSYTVNVYPWHPAFPPPYVVAIVELHEQPDVRLTTNIVDTSPDEVRIGMRLAVRFLHFGEIFLPIFAPAEL